MKLVSLFLFLSHSITSYSQSLDVTEDEANSENSPTDIIWGKKVQDKYRWMEYLQSGRTLYWLKKQDSLREKHKGKELKSMTELLNRFSMIYYTAPSVKQGKYFFSLKRERFKTTPSLFYRRKIFQGDALLFDPNSLDKKSIISIEDYKLSPDNNTLAMLLSKNGSDWKTARFLDLESQQLLKDSISFIKYSPIYWYKNGIFYCKYDSESTQESFLHTIKGYALYYHKLGTDQKNDVLIYKPKDEYQRFYFQVTQKSKYLIIKRTEEKYDKISISTLNDSLIIHHKDFIVIKNDDNYCNIFGELNGKLLALSNLYAPNGAIYTFDPTDVNKAEIFLNQGKDQLNSAMIIGNKIVCAFDTDKKPFAIIIDSEGKLLYRWFIPEGHKFSQMSGSVEDNMIIYKFDSFFNPVSVYTIDLETYENIAVGSTYIFYDNSDIVTEKVYYRSKDSTVIPIFLTHKKKIKLDGNNPVLLYGYGGFGTNMDPFYNPANVLFFKNGGILATPCLRGGGEYPGWHKKGMGLNKQNTFDDFIAAATYLIDKKYTNSDKIAAMGGSHGGLVVGACMVQRPDLFKVVVANAGVFDMMRYHLFNVGYGYKDEIGNITDSLDFENLINYSPLHNVKKGVNYPALLLVASDNDDRVAPFHSFKLLASVQEKTSGTNPHILYYAKKAGHSGNGSFANFLNENAYIYSFIFDQLGMEIRKWR